MKFAAIADWADRNEFPVTFMCDRLGVSTSGYYKWRTAEPPDHERYDKTLTTLITNAFARLRDNPGVRVPGVRRSLQTLRDIGLGYLRLGQPATEQQQPGEGQAVGGRGQGQLRRGQAEVVLQRGQRQAHHADREDQRELHRGQQRERPSRPPRRRARGQGGARRRDTGPGLQADHHNPF